IERRLSAHAAAGGEIFVAADAGRSSGIDQNDVERLERMADAFEFGFDLRGGDNMTIGKLAEIKLDAGMKKPVERHLIDSHHRLAVDRLRLEMDRRIPMHGVMGGERDLFDWPGFPVGPIPP